MERDHHPPRPGRGPHEAMGCQWGSRAGRLLLVTLKRSVGHGASPGRPSPRVRCDATAPPLRAGARPRSAVPRCSGRGGGGRGVGRRYCAAGAAGHDPFRRAPVDGPVGVGEPAVADARAGRPPAHRAFAGPHAPAFEFERDPAADHLSSRRSSSIRSTISDGVRAGESAGRWSGPAARPRRTCRTGSSTWTGRRRPRRSVRAIGRLRQRSTSLWRPRRSRGPFACVTGAPRCFGRLRSWCGGGMR